MDHSSLGNHRAPLEELRVKIQAGMWAQMMHAASSGRVRGTHSHSSAGGGGDVLTMLSPFLKM